MLVIAQGPIRNNFSSGSLDERAYNHTVIWNVRSPKMHKPEKACVSFLLVGGNIVVTL